MNNIQKQKELRIKNMMVLTLQSESLGKQGWTLKEFSNLCQCSRTTARTFINKCILMGYVIKRDTDYTWIKTIPSNPESILRTATFIAKNFQKPVYKQISITDFSDDELMAELIKRNILQ